MRKATVAMAAAVLAAGIGSSEAADKTIILGYHIPLSGDSSHYGEVFRNAAVMQLEAFNASGAMPGVKVEIRFEDSKNDAREARNIAQMFIDDPAIVGVLGDFSSTVSMAAGEIYAEAGMPQLSQTASHPDFTKISEWQFRNITTQAFEGPFNARWVKEQGHQRVHVVAIQNDWGLSASTLFADAFKAEGGEITGMDYFNPGNRDFRSILTKINRASPDAIYLCMFYEEGAAFLQQRQQLNVTAPVYGASSLYNLQLVTLAGAAVDGLKLASTFVPDNPAPNVKSFVDAYTARYGQVPSQFAAQAFDAVGIMLEALKKAGPDATRESLRAALAETKDYPGVTGTTTFDPETREPSKSMARMEVTDGKFVVIH